MKFTIVRMAAMSAEHTAIKDEARNVSSLLQYHNPSGDYLLVPSADSAEVILARYCMMIFVASVLPDPLSPLMMIDWFDEFAFLTLMSSFVSESASMCPFTCAIDQRKYTDEKKYRFFSSRCTKNFMLLDRTLCFCGLISAR